jgi:hypothetical protein
MTTEAGSIRVSPGRYVREVFGFSGVNEREYRDNTRSAERPERY